MNIKDIEHTLPNGFHDAYLDKMITDFMHNEAVFHFRVDISDPDAGELEPRLKKLVLTCSGLIFCMIQPPNLSTQLKLSESLWVTDSDPADSTILDAELIESVPDGAFIHYFFLTDWNAFIFISAMTASFEWVDE